MKIAKHNFAAIILVAFVITLFYFVFFKNTIFSFENMIEVSKKMLILY